jgi:hypothetical protein
MVTPTGKSQSTIHELLEEYRDKYVLGIISGTWYSTSSCCSYHYDNCCVDEEPLLIGCYKDESKGSIRPIS